MPAKLTREKYIEKAISVHGERYGYSQLEYLGSKKKVIIICEEHGEFLQTASDHISGCGCPKCDNTLKLGSNKFIERSIELHGERYDYSLVEYGSNNYEPVVIICKEHGEFSQRPWAHLRGQGCPNCSNNKIMSTKEFIKKSNDIHNNIYDYSLVEYKGRRKDVSIICKEHGIFWQEARVHLDGFGCKRCKSSKLENYLSTLFKSVNEPFIVDKKFDDCRRKQPLPFDFYLPLRNMLIECDGIQHHKPIEYFGGEDRFIYQKENDNIKDEWTSINGIKLIRLNSIKECDNFVNTIKSTHIEYDKSMIKDLSIGRKVKTKVDDLVSTDFNWYNGVNIRNEIFNFITDCKIEFESDVVIDDMILDYYMGNTAIYVVDNFRDCEINRGKRWLVNLKDSLEKINCNLIVIYPEQWINKSNIVKSRIKNTFGLYDNKIGARKCKIVEINDNKLVYKFLDDNHIQGKINASVKLGLEYGGELVSIMTFGRVRRNLGAKGSGWELLRFCNKSGYVISGAASRLFNYFLKKYKPESIISYADRCWSKEDSNVYLKLGMEYKGKTEPSYCYLSGKEKFDRFKFRKDVLVNYGYDVNQWTERSICGSNGIFRIYDAGCLKFQLSST